MGGDIVELERRFNTHCGVDRSDDALPYRFDDLNETLDEYYHLREWSPEGVADGEVT